MFSSANDALSALSEHLILIYLPRTSGEWLFAPGTRGGNQAARPVNNIVRLHQSLVFGSLLLLPTLCIVPLLQELRIINAISVKNPAHT
jgi:hypothetical protein